MPGTQHGFRSKRSTQTAWSQVQQNWANDTEKKKLTGVLMWDLTAGFDTLDHNIMHSPLVLHVILFLYYCQHKSSIAYEKSEIIYYYY